MRKTHILRFFLLLLVAANAVGVRAEKKNVIFQTPEEYQILDISPNGKWACGIYIDYSDNYYGFRWNLLSGKTELLSTASQSEAWSVSNDGVVAGSVTTSPSAGEAERSMPAIYKDGQWMLMACPAGTVADGICHGISPDGHYVCGYVVIGDEYKGYIWRDGALYRSLGDERDVMPYCISPDGQGAGGWTMTKNRQATYWTPGGEIMFLSDNTSPWSYARNFSADGKKLLFWGGWNPRSPISELLSVYDVTTGEKQYIPTVTLEADMALYDISDNGVVVGQESNRGFVYADGKSQYLDAYLTARGVDVSKLGAYKVPGTDFYQLYRAQTVNEDASVLGFVMYAESGKDQAAMRSVVVKFDYDASLEAPSSFRAEQLSGISSVRLTWSAHVSTESVKGYNIYRDGVKIASVGSKTLSYYDNGLETKKYTYTVTAQLETGETAHSEAQSVTVELPGIQSPRNVKVRQKGFYNALLAWTEPLSHAITKTYIDYDNCNRETFGPLAELTFEIAIRFDKDEVAAYKGNKVRQVSFCPMSEQKEWTLVFYTYTKLGMLQELYSQKITQELNYGEKNTITLDTPLEMPDGELIAAVRVDVNKPTTNVIGIDYGTAEMQYSDLVRLTTDADFYSLSETSSASGYMYRASWLMDIQLSGDDYSAELNKVDHYAVTVDGTETMTTTALNATVTGLASGNHTLGVKAVYADGRVSDIVEASQNIVQNTNALPAVSSRGVEFTNTTDMNVVWHRPTDKESKSISYSGETPYNRSVTVPDGKNFIQFAALYPSSMFKTYEGYGIKTLRFYPLSDANFTFFLYKDNDLIAEVPVDDVKLNTWNSVTLDEPVTIEKNASYRLVIDCFDVLPGYTVVAVDNEAPFTGYSDLYSLDGETYASFAETGIVHNLMLGMTIEDSKGYELPVKGYDVNIDGEKKNAQMITGTSFQYSFSEKDDKQHTVSVDVYYEPVAQSVKGENLYFYIGSSTDIEENVIADITVRQENSFITVTGDNVENVTIISADGTVAAQAKGNSVSLNGVPAGAYILKAKAAGKDMVRKITVTRE